MLVYGAATVVWAIKVTHDFRHHVEADFLVDAGHPRDVDLLHGGLGAAREEPLAVGEEPLQAEPQAGPGAGGIQLWQGGVGHQVQGEGAIHKGQVYARCLRSTFGERGHFSVNSFHLIVKVLWKHHCKQKCKIQHRLPSLCKINPLDYYRERTTLREEETPWRTWWLSWSCCPSWRWWRRYDDRN